MKFSIVIPCFNRHEELQIALRSCLGQTFADLEVIVVDDHSEPSLEETCLAFGDDRVRYFRNNVNLGVSASRNAGLALAEGVFVSFLDSDDMYLPYRLEVIDKLISSASEVPDIVLHRQQRIISRGKDIGIVTPSRMPRSGERLDEFVMIAGQFLQTNSFTVRTDLARKVKFDTNCQLYEDTKFIIECWLCNRNFISSEDVLSIYNDFNNMQRLSRMKSVERMRPMLAFAQTRCSIRAALGFEALTCGENSFLRHPIHILTTLLNAWRAGVPAVRCAVFFLRSVFGSYNVDTAISAVRILAASKMYARCRFGASQSL